MKLARRMADESGVALITALLAVMLMSALMVGMFAALATDQRSHAVDRDQTQAYAAAHAGLEKLTSGLASLFVTDVSPSVAQINAVAVTPPVIPGYSFTSPGGVPGSGYAITYPVDGFGNPLSSPMDITTGPFTGFKGIITPYTVTITAVSPGGAEVRLRRDLQTVAVPVFQFGVFSDSDLTFYAGDNFGFGGRVHTNQNLFVCEFGGTMTFTDRITAVQDVIHNYFSNGLLATTYGCSGPVNILTAPGVFRNLQQAPNEGSIAGMPGSAANPNWTTISTGTYKSYIRNGLTGAKRLDLPLVSQGAFPVDLIRRPALNSNENVANAPVFGQRYFSQASLRILLSDRAADITNLPTVTGAAPVQLDGTPAGYVVGPNRPPIAKTIGGGWAGGPGQTTVAAGATAATINVAAIPAALRIQNAGVLNQINVGGVLVTCTGKTLTTFTGCPNAPAVGYPAGTVVTATLPSGFIASTTISALPLASTYTAVSTAAFSQNLIWVESGAGALSVPVTCTGYTPAPAFTNCIGLAGNPAAGRIVSTHALAPQNSGLIGGFIKIEKQDAGGVWSDVTMEILNLGIGGRNSEGTICNEPTQDAILRIQRLRDNANTSVCTYNNSQDPYDWWPNTLYDTREGTFRDIATGSPMMMGGVMQYISLDVNNLKRWFSGAIGATGVAALNNNGYIVYFSDRRGNHNTLAAGSPETGEYGFEDKVNPTTAAGLPDSILQAGEDLNTIPPALPTQELYGGTPDPLNFAAGSQAPYSAAGQPQSVISLTNAPQARVNKVVLFRRALKLMNGGIVAGVNSLPVSGLTVASENPVYVQGNYNATTDPLAEPNVPASIVADAVTLLSNSWSDAVSFQVPNLATNRNATTTGYRMGVVAGKGLSFTYCGAACGSPGFLYGTDGGVGNFLRLLEDWNIAGVSINYRGSLVTLHISRQATGTFKYNTNVYDFGTRNFTFDTDFLTPALLPPGTPMFRDINTLKFRQILRPNQ
jgi:hypothetical protein